MKKYILRSLFVFMLTASMTLQAAPVKLIDYLVTSTGVTELLGKYGIKGNDAKQVESYVASSLSSFGNGRTLQSKELSDALSKLVMNKDDAKVRRELQLLLDKKDADLKKEDVVAAINHIIYLANRHGKSVVITCADCVSDSLAKNGFKFTVENIKNETSLKLLNDIIPADPKQLNAYIVSKLKRLGFGDVRPTPASLPAEEERTFALFLASFESGTPEFKEFGAMVKKLSTNGNKSDIFSTSNPNKLWRFVTKDLSGEEVTKITQALKETDDLARREKLSIEEAFNQVLRNKSESNADLMTKLKAVKNRRCFFK